MARKSTDRQLVPIAARTASGNTADLIAPFGANVRILYTVTVVSGTAPTLILAVQGKSSSGNYHTVHLFSTISIIGSNSVYIEALPNTYRIRWIIAGASPSFTFEVYETLETVD